MQTVAVKRTITSDDGIHVRNNFGLLFIMILVKEKLIVKTQQYRSKNEWHHTLEFKRHNDRDAWNIIIIVPSCAVHGQE